MALDGIPLDHPWRIVQGVIPGAPAGSAIRIEKHADRYRVITAVGAMDAATTAVEPQSDGRLLVRNPECGVRLLLEPTGHSRASDTVGRALLLPFVVAAVGMVLAWWLMLAAPSGGDTWGLRFLFEIPLASGSVGLLAGGASAHSDRSVGFLGGLVGYCVATLALELAWPSHYMIQFGLLAGLPFVLAYGLGRVGARYLARH